MENALLYLIIAAGIALVAAGAYGAAPALFPRRRLHAEGGHHAVGPIFTLGRAFPLLEEDLRQPLAALTEVIASTTTSADSPGQERPEFDPAIFDPDAPEPAAVYSTPDFDEALLTDLMTEIEMLRSQIEGLRSELGMLSLHAATAVRARQPVTPESKRRARSANADLPPRLRRQLVEVRKQKKSA